MHNWPEHGIDVHLDIVRLPAPPSFVFNGADIRFKTSKNVYEGNGTVKASIAELSGEMKLGIVDFVGEFNDRSTIPNRLIPESDFAEVMPLEPTSPSWTADGAYKTSQSIGTEIAGQRFSFTLGRVSLRYGVGDVTFTREVFRGTRLRWLRQYTPNGESGFRLDRVEGRALGRRTSIRDLQTGEDAMDNTVAVVYDGAPHAEIDSDALWLGCSLLAGQALQAAVTDTYDATGQLLTRTFRLGTSNTAAPDPPFHIHYAPFDPQWLEQVIDAIAEKLRNGFPIDVMIAHLQDATDGSMERRMQSYLLALHAASEAWTRSNGATTVFPKTSWAATAAQLGDAALTAVSLDAGMQETVRAKLRDANNTGTAARMRACCEALGIALVGDDKKAVDLRNVLFHDGYLRRRFKDLSLEQRQSRFHQMLRLRDFVYRFLFSLLGFEGRFHSALNPYAAIVARNLETAPNPSEERKVMGQDTA